MNLFADHDVKNVFDNKINDEFESDCTKCEENDGIWGVFCQ